MADGLSLDDQQVTKLERLANAMAATSEDPRAAAVERRARRLVTAERERRDDWIRQRYEELAAKRNAGLQLTDDERADLSRLGRVLAEDQ